MYSIIVTLDRNINKKLKLKEKEKIIFISKQNKPQPDRDDI